MVMVAELAVICIWRFPPQRGVQPAISHGSRKQSPYCNRTIAPKEVVADRTAGQAFYQRGEWQCGKSAIGFGGVAVT